MKFAVGCRKIVLWAGTATCEFFNNLHNGMVFLSGKETRRGKDRITCKIHVCFLSWFSPPMDIVY